MTREEDRENTPPPNEERIRARDLAREEGEPRLPEFQLRRIRRIVDGAGKAYGGIGGTVLDPFMGSGSTGKAAILEGFSFIGIEREADYIKIAESRIQCAEMEESK